MFIISSSPHLTVFALPFLILALALIIGSNFYETTRLDDVYATITNADSNSNNGNANSGVLNNSGSIIPPSGSYAFLNSSLVSTVMSESTTQNNTKVGNSTSTPVNTNTSSGPQPGSLQIAYTGLSRYHVTPEVAKLFGLNDTTYAMIITEVEPRSPAAIAGIRGGNMTTNVAGNSIKIGGDIILGIDGNDTFIRSNEAFLNYLQNEKRVGENMTFTVLRDGQINDVELTIGALPRFLWYEDNDEGIKIKYPSDWAVSESESIDEVVKFFPPQVFRVGNETIPVAGIFIKLAPSGDTSLDDFATVERRDTRDTRNLGLTLTSVSNLPGYETVFYDYSDENRPLKELSRFTIKDGKIYRVNFATDPSRYDEYLPLAKEVISSFQFTR